MKTTKKVKQSSKTGKLDHRSLLARPAGVHRVARALYLKVMPGRRLRAWVYRYRDRVTGKHRWMGLGGFPERRLGDVKEHRPKDTDPPGFNPWTAQRCRETLLDGYDPIAERTRERNAERVRRALSGPALRGDDGAVVG